jgi:hypothetical protein
VGVSSAMAAEEATSMEAVARSHAGVRRFMRTTVEERAGGGKDSVVKWLVGGIKRSDAGKELTGQEQPMPGPPSPQGVDCGKLLCRLGLQEWHWRLWHLAENAALAEGFLARYPGDRRSRCRDPLPPR